MSRKRVLVRRSGCSVAFSNRENYTGADLNTKEIVTAIDAEIDRLQRARGILAGTRRKVMSPEARARISASMKQRWATARKAAN